MRDLHLCSLVPQPHLLYILWKAGLVFDIDFVGLWSYVPSRNVQLNLCSELKQWLESGVAEEDAVLHLLTGKFAFFTKISNIAQRCC